jgi:hypothetical protein
MGHLIEEYAKNLGVKIGKPVFNPHYIPIVDEKYITIHIDNKFDSRYYEFFPEVIDLMKDVLHKNGYKIYQIGGGEDPPLPNIDKQYLGFSRKQSAFIIKNASLHLGIDSFPVHVASSFDIPIVALYSNVNVQNSKPIWSSENKVRILESNKNGKRPSYAQVEKPKTIHTIYPEEIVKNIFELLNIPYTSSIKTLFIGEDYSNSCVDVIPNFFGESDELKKRIINVRADFHFDENVIAQWCNQYQSNIYLDREININLLKSFKHNIKGLVFFIDSEDSFSEEYLDQVKNTGIPLQCVSRNTQDIAKIRLKYFDTPIILEKQVSEETVERIRNAPNLKFLTRKDILSVGKRYSSKAHADEDKVFLDKVSDVIDTSAFWKDLEHYYIYESC